MSNIFILDYNLYDNCRYHADQHVIAGLAELPRILAANYSHEQLAKFNQTRLPFTNKFVEWCFDSRKNWEYVIEMWKCLNHECILRFNKSHSDRFITFVESNPPNFLKEERTGHVCAFALGSRARLLSQKITDVVELYREYYREKKFLVWSNKKPEWI